MARKENAETEEMEAQDDGQGEFVPAKPSKAKSDVYTTMLILAFLAFLAGSIVSGREAWEHYDVQFGMFEKRQGGGASAPTEEPPVDASATPPADAPAPAPADAPK